MPAPGTMLAGMIDQHEPTVSAQGERFDERLVIISHVVHFRKQRDVFAYAPYAREIEIWADIFQEVIIAAPLREGPVPGDCTLVRRSNIRVIPQRELGGETFKDKVRLLAGIPSMSWDLMKAIRQGNAVHVRCPGNLGLLGVMIAPLFSKRLVAKYAGQWKAGTNDPWSIRFQRQLLRSRWWGSPVTVYGRWPNEPDHIVPFFNSVLTSEHIERAQASMKKREEKDLKHVLFVGRLSRAKNVDVLIRALGRLRAEGLVFSATIAGEGPESAFLHDLAKSEGVADRIHFAGGVDFERIVSLLERSGVLVLASETEGWPKAIVEGMAFGLVAIGSDVGLVTEILGSGRGFTVKPGDVDALTLVLRNVLKEPGQYSDMREKAAAWARQYSIEALRDSIRTLLEQRWRRKAVSKLRTA